MMSFYFHPIFGFQISYFELPPDPARTMVQFAAWSERWTTKQMFFYRSIFYLHRF